MQLNLDPVLMINLVLCVVILVMGIWEYTKSKSWLPLYIGIAFGLFGVSHLITMLGLGTGLSGVIIMVRLLAYVLVIFALYQVIAKKKNA
ncbi:MAG: hypothetical protein NT082_05770 [Chloroflexi bacterium]|nr:hypothetical protein [Chloroflexota bacterium]